MHHDEQMNELVQIVISFQFLVPKTDKRLSLNKYIWNAHNKFRMKNDRTERLEQRANKSSVNLSAYIISY